MRPRFCIHVKGQKHGNFILEDSWICFPLMDQVLQLPPMPVPPEDPYPEFITGLDIAPAVLHDVQALAAVHAVSARLSERSRSVVQEVVLAQIGRLGLPDNVRVHL